MKNCLYPLLSLLFLITFESVSQPSPRLFDGKKSPKTFLSTVDGMKRTGLQKFSMVLDTIHNVETTEFTLPKPEVFTINNGVRRKVRRIEHPRFFHLKKGLRSGVITIQGDDIMGVFGGFDIGNQGLSPAETPNIPFEQEEPPLPPNVELKQTAEQIQENKVVLKAEANVIPGNNFPISPQVASKVYVIDYDMYQLLGSNITTCNNWAQTIHANTLQYWNQQGITTQLTKIIVLTSPSQFSSLTSTVQALPRFAQDYINENADLLHLFTDIANGGGLAYKGAGPGRLSPTRFCVTCPFVNLNTTTNTKGWNYGWTLNCTAHEEGHVFGSNHTHWGGWLHPDGRLGPLDSCFTVESDPISNTYSGPFAAGIGNVIAVPELVPKNGGTILSYCHLVTIPNSGINMDQGFHPQCGEVMRRTLRSSSVPGGPTTNCVYVYGSWGPCVRGYQTRTVTPQVTDCKGLPQELYYRTCVENTFFPEANMNLEIGSGVIIFYDNSIGNPFSWYWEIINQSTGTVVRTSTSKDSGATLLNTGIYTVRLTVCNSVGVSQKITTNIVVNN